MEQAHGVGLKSGIGGNGVIPFFRSFFGSGCHLCVSCQWRQRVAGGELRHLAYSPGGVGGFEGSVTL